MSYDKELVKEQIELEDVYNLLDFFDADPQMFNTYIIARTICHGGDSHKLCYFTKSKDFYCYTNCGRMPFFEFIKNSIAEERCKISRFEINSFNEFSKNFNNGSHKKMVINLN